MELTIETQVVGRHQQLQTHLDGNVHVGDEDFLLVSVPVVEILHHLLHYRATRRSGVAVVSKPSSFVFESRRRWRNRDEKDTVRSSVDDASSSPWPLDHWKR